MTNWDDRFRNGEHTGRAPAEALGKLVDVLPAGRALDLACGAGRHSTLLAEHGWDVIAVDSSAVALSLIAPHERIKTVLADLEKGELVIEAEAYDLIVCWLYWQADLVAPMLRGTRAGGTLAIAARISGRFAANVELMDASVARWEIPHRALNRDFIELIARKPPAI